MPWNTDLEKGTPAYDLATSQSRVIRSVAGPGSGKTFAIKRRIARLLEQGTNPRKILAISFTRTASQDLAKEIAGLGIPGADEIETCTLHSHALTMIRKRDILERTLRYPRMVIDHEMKPALRDLTNEKYGNIDEKEKLLNGYLAFWAENQTDEPGRKTEIQVDFERQIVAWLKYHEGILVGEVIPIAVTYLLQNPGSPEIGKYETILVDEYQDLNRSEQEYIRIISRDCKVIIVGDDDQSIYGFKFAFPEGIKRIEELYGEFKDIPFAVCRRCPQIVTKMADSLIHYNSNRTLSNLLPYEKNATGDVSILQWSTLKDEVEGLAAIIDSEIKAQNVSAGDVLILTPRKKIGYKLRDKLLSMELPVKTHFREAVIKNDNVRRAYSLINLMIYPMDKISLRFLLGFKSGDFRQKQYLALQEKAAREGISIRDLLNSILAGTIKLKGVSTILSEYRKIVLDLVNLKQFYLENMNDSIFDFFAKTPDDEEEYYEINGIYIAALKTIGTMSKEDGEEILLENLKKAYSIMKEKIALPDMPENEDQIKIMTLHSSKGLSAKMVIITSMIDQLMPFIHPKVPEGKKAAVLEEQRRLFYVGITRCKSSENNYPGKLIISSFIRIHNYDAGPLNINCPGRFREVYASQFLAELGPEAPKTVFIR